MKNSYLYITLISLLGLHVETQAQTAPGQPRLVVNIMIDQLREDYLEAFSSLYGYDGLRLMLANGVVFTDASYTFPSVDQASAAATWATGTVPYYHGIVASEWLDRQTLRPQQAVRDLSVGSSPRFLATSTLGDELKVSTDGQSKVYSFAAQADAAILSAGHAADGVAWTADGRWHTTAYYVPASQWLNDCVQSVRPSNDANRSVTSMALKCVEEAGLGMDDVPDMLCVTYVASPLKEGYVALDRTLAELLSGVRSKIQEDRVLFVLAGTGGTERQERQERTARFRIPTGTFDMKRTSSLLNIYLGAVYGAAQYVEAAYANQVYLNHRLFEQKNIPLGDVLQQSQVFLLQMAGVRNVYTSRQLQTTDSPMLSSVRNGFCVEKCGDLLLEIAPGWQLVNEDFNQTQTVRAGAVPFPIIFYGAGLKPRRVALPATVDRIAPTVAKILRIRAPNACTCAPLF